MKINTMILFIFVNITITNEGLAAQPKKNTPLGNAAEEAKAMLKESQEESRKAAANQRKEKEKETRTKEREK